MEGVGGVRLRAALFPAQTARGSVVLNPGRAEPIEKYYEVIEELRARGFSVLVHDWRGQGLSQRLVRDPLRGHGAPWRVYLGDLGLVLAAFEARAPRPWLALGHSMGGGLTALALAEGETRFAAAVLSAPMVSLNLGGIPLLAGRAIAFVLSGLGFASRYVVGPGDPLGGRFKTNVLTHDRARWTRNVALFEAHPALRLGNVTWAWLTFALSIPGRLAAVTRLSTPMTVVLAAEERLIDNQAARDFAARVGAKLVEVPGARHEIMMETDERRALFWAAFDARVETI